MSDTPRMTATDPLAVAQRAYEGSSLAHVAWAKLAPERQDLWRIMVAHLTARPGARRSVVQTAVEAAKRARREQAAA